MRGLLTVILPAALILAGCAAAPQTNSNLLLPKFVVDLRYDGRVEIFIHSAFGEHAYDNLTLRVDNATLRTVNATRSIDEVLDARAFFLEVLADKGRSRFEFRGLVQIDAERPSRALVSELQHDEFRGPTACNLPCEWIVPQAPTESAEGA